MAKEYRVGSNGAAARAPFLLSRKGPATGGERAVLQGGAGTIKVSKSGPAAGNDR